MKRVDNLNAPSLNGWIIAAGAGVLAFVIAKVVGGFDYTTSGFFAALITGVAGLVIGMPWGAADRIPKPEVDAEHGHAATAAPAATPVSTPVAAPAAPVAPMAEAAPLMAPPMVSSDIVAEPAAPAAAPAPKAAPKPKAEAEPKAAAKPAAKAKAEPAPAPEGGSKPKALKAARKGVADDLKVIEGIGPAMEKLLNEGGIFHLDQIASWGPAEVEWMDGNLKGFKGRVTRDKWVAQAKLIGEVGIEQFLIRAKTNDY